jgi:hypothetical protein
MKRLALIVLLLGTPALAHDASRPELNSWFDHLASGKGLCCSFWVRKRTATLGCGICSAKSRGALMSNIAQFFKLKMGYERTTLTSLGLFAIAVPSYLTVGRLPARVLFLRREI